jgi:hypothetical protein
MTVKVTVLNLTNMDIPQDRLPPGEINIVKSLEVGKPIDELPLVSLIARARIFLDELAADPRFNPRDEVCIIAGENKLIVTGCMQCGAQLFEQRFEISPKTVAVLLFLHLAFHEIGNTPKIWIQKGEQGNYVGLSEFVGEAKDWGSVLYEKNRIKLLEQEKKE